MNTQVRLTRNEEFKLTPAEELIWYYRKYPVQAAKDLLNVDLVWFQRKILYDLWHKKYVLLLMSRGIGKTWIDALFATLYAMLHPGVMIGIITPSFKQTEFLFDKIADFYDSSAYLRASCDRVQRATYKAIVRFNNGSFIEGLPLGAGQKIRGRRYNIIILDEYASIDETIIKTVIRPMMNVKKKGIDNKYIISGTAYYTWNHFYLQYLLYNLMASKQPDLYSIHEYTIDDINCVADAPFELDQEVYEMMRMDTTEELYLMENKVIFPIENVGFFSARMIDLCTPKATEITQPVEIEVVGDPQAYYTMGIDSARVAGGDNFSISILKLSNGSKHFVHGFILNGATYQEMVFNIRRLLSDFNIIQIDMDAGGGGTTLKDLLMTEYKMPNGKTMLAVLDMDDPLMDQYNGVRMLRMINFTRPVVNDLYMRLKADMQHKTVLFPIDIRHSSDKELERVAKEILETKRELLVIQAEGKGNYYQFSVPTQFKKDRATSLVLANQAANDHISKDSLKVVNLEPASGFWI